MRTTVVAGALALGLAAPAARADPAALVDPFIGTAGAGATVPGAAVPFGLVQFSPETVPGTAGFGAGYARADRRIRGFSPTHVSGTGCAVFGDVPLLPVAARVRSPPGGDGAPQFSHARESAAPGRYGVVLDPGTPRAIGVALTATARTGAARLRFPAGRPASVLLDAGGSQMADDDAAVRVDPGRREISGWAVSGRTCGQRNRYRVFFAARFDRPLRDWGTWRRGVLRPRSAGARDTARATGIRPVPGGPPTQPPRGARAGAYAEFVPGATVEVRVGVSFVSVDGARRNLAAESAGRSFGALQRAARTAWNRALGRATVAGGTRGLRTTFTTALYHALLHPNIFSDADGRYTGMDGRVHRARGWTKYATVSGWDAYRTQGPLLAMLLPRRSADMMRSLVADADQSGCLPKWTVAAGQTNVMVGDPAAALLASAHALGVRGFDAVAALRHMVRGATRDCRSANGGYVEREGLADLLSLGYVAHRPGDGAAAHNADPAVPWGAASTTLEYAIADFAIARLARALGQAGTAGALLRRSGAWRALVDPATRTIAARGPDGAFVRGPAALADPVAALADGTGFVEGSAAQYAWLVPHDVAGLTASMGGADVARGRLDDFLAQLDGGPASPHAWLGNEPSLGAPWLYDWLGAPWRTQRAVRRALLELYHPAPDGLPGNDDAGALSAWFVLGALGLSPAIPGEDVLALGSPLFPRAELRLPGGLVRIAAAGAAAGRPYVHAARLDGRPLQRPWLRFADLRRGGRLSFSVRTVPDRAWGADPAQAPPSFGPGSSAVRPAGLSLLRRMG